MKTFRCNNCGYEKIKTEQDIFDDECDLCNIGRFELIEKKPEIETDRADIVLNNLIANQLKRDIEIDGNEAVWHFIETIGLVSKRLQYRKIFFVVGGEVPEIGLFKIITKQIIGKSNEEIWLI
jgi:hypothetical protein